MENEPLSDIARELLDMFAADQSMRVLSLNDMEQWDDSIDHQNTARLREIISQIGWPTIPKVGAEASRAAWLIAQHAYADPDFMMQCLELMRQSDGDIDPANPAFLEDRLCTMEGKPQIYGTQFRNVGGGWKPSPIQDPESVDTRRASVGLDTLAEGTARINEIYSA